MIPIFVVDCMMMLLIALTCLRGWWLHNTYSHTLKHNIWKLLELYVIPLFTLSTFVRAILILVTSLPDPHPQCHNPDLSFSFTVMQRMWRFMILQDTMTCGDCIVSGHTVAIMCAWLTWQHMQGKTKLDVFVHIWTLACLFAVTVSRLHYTLDVVVTLAFMLSFNQVLSIVYTRSVGAT